jgi:predicted RNA-binding Zn ribbon-like protein
MTDPGPVRRGARQGPLGSEFELTGGALCLDLANTLDRRKTPSPRERLGRYQDLVAWGRQAGALSESRADALLRRAAAQPKPAATTLRRVRDAREAIFGIFSALARAEAAPAPDVARLNAALRTALGRRLLQARPAGGFGWTWDTAETSLDEVLWPALLSAAELLTGAERTRVRECASDTCAWLFLDRSKNASRRWCDMAVCGNRAKARRHRGRLRGGRAQSST